MNTDLNIAHDREEMFLRGIAGISDEIPDTRYNRKELYLAAIYDRIGQGGGAVSSVNGKTGIVVLGADDIMVQNSQTIQANLERIDDELGSLEDNKADKTDFTGTDGDDDGEQGLVPAPAAADAGKFLKSDGTWAEAGSSINVVQSGGTSMTDVMSQAATTGLVFPDSDTSSTCVKIGNSVSINNNRTVTIGYSSKTSGSESVSLGAYAEGWGSSGVCVGDASKTKMYTSGCVAVGKAANANANGATCIGAYTETAGAYSVAAGEYSKTTVQGEFSIGNSTATNLYNNTGYRKITNVYDGENAHDAATYGQLQAEIARLEARIAALEA